MLKTLESYLIKFAPENQTKMQIFSFMQIKISKFCTYEIIPSILFKSSGFVR